MNTLTDREKEIVKEIYPLLKQGKYQEATNILGRINGEIDTPTYLQSIGFNIINFLKENGIDILHKITKISYYLFAGTENLTEVVIPENIQYINNGAFSRCRALKSVIIPDSVEGIGDFAFYGCKLEEIKIPSSVKRIECGAFADCTKLKKVNLGNGVQYIGKRAFDDCDALETIYYDGTQEEWDAVNKYESWNGSNVEKVTCLRK